MSPPPGFQQRNPWSSLEDPEASDCDIPDVCELDAREWKTPSESTSEGSPRVAPSTRKFSKVKKRSPFEGLGKREVAEQAKVMNVDAETIRNPKAFMAASKSDISAIRDKNDLCLKLLQNLRVSEANAAVDARVVKGVREDEAEEDVETEGQVKHLGEDPSVICHVSGEWEEFEGLLDSGSSTNVASPDVGQGVEIRESLGSRTGHVYHTADGSKLPNLGEKVLHV